MTPVDCLQPQSVAEDSDTDKSIIASGPDQIACFRQSFPAIHVHMSNAWPSSGTCVCLQTTGNYLYTYTQ